MALANSLVQEQLGDEAFKMRRSEVVKPFLARLGINRSRQPLHNLDCDMLLAELKRMPDDWNREMPVAIQQLWQAFIVLFDGIDGFLQAGREEREAYLRSLAASAQGMQTGLCSLAVALFAAYVRLIEQPSPDKPARELAEAVAHLISSAPHPALSRRNATQV